MTPLPLTTLRGAVAYLPEGVGHADVVLAGSQVLDVRSPSGASDRPEGPGAVVDCSGLLILPGLVDGHLHLLGGGGGAGYGSRIPELPEDAILEAGITSCVGMPGVDSMTKSTESLLARAYALEHLGLRVRVMLGGFRWPTPSLTGSLVRDLYLLPHVVGVKVALFERLAAAPDTDEITRLLGDLEWAGNATGKACLLHVHLGTGRGARDVLARCLDRSGASPQRLQVTHVNYCEDNVDAAVELAKRGCWVDVNPLINPDRIAGSVDPVRAIATLLSAGVPRNRITLSTDGNASVPRQLPDGSRERFSRQLDLLTTVRTLVDEGVLDLGSALALVTANPATALRLAAEGRLEPGGRADVVVVDDELRVRKVYVGGREVVRAGRAVDVSPFRDPRWPDEEANPDGR